MKLEDQFKYLVGGYYGIRELDEYNLKEFVLSNVESYIKDFIETNPIADFDYRREALAIEKELDLKTKFQDALLVLNKIKAPIEVVLLVKKRLKQFDN